MANIITATIMKIYFKARDFLFIKILISIGGNGIVV